MIYYSSLMILAFIGVISIIILILVYLDQISTFHLDSERLNSDFISIIRDNIIPDLGNSSDFLTIRRHDTHSPNYIKISKDLIKYSYALHPIRIAIMKCLSEGPSMTSTDLRQELKLNWNDYTPHINALEKKGMLSTETRFVDDKALKTLDITQSGQHAFQDISNKLLVLVS